MGSTRSDLHDQVDDYLNRKEAVGLAALTLSSYRTSLAAFLASLGEIPGETEAASITREQVRAWVAGMVEAGRKPSTVQIRLQGVRRFFRDAVNEEWCTTNPTDKVEVPTVRPPVIEFPDDEQVRRLLKVTQADASFAGKRDYALLRLLAETGARRSEIANLAADASLVDFNTSGNGDSPSGFADLNVRIVYIRRGKGGGSREVGFSSAAALALRRYMRVRDGLKGPSECPWLWVSRSHERQESDRGRLLATAVNEIFRRRCRLADVRKADGAVFSSPHSLRHAWASRMLRDGLNLLDVKALGGWSSLEMLSQRYGQFQANERAVEAARRITPRF